MEGQAFRPSPNFKHMKKYQKAKAHLSTAVEEPTPATPISPVEDPKPAEPAVEQPPLPEVKQEPCALQPYEDQPPQQFEDQPPLPPDIKPPLIDFKPSLHLDMYSSPPPLPVNPPPVDIKEEMQEAENQYMEPHMQYNDYEPMMSEEPETNEIMCRNFARGLCTRGSSCIYTHRVIQSQLKDVYRFCNDFQNGSCKRPVCRFVHATVFQKEHFYRTGYLPPEVRAHIQETLSVFTTPPPPPPHQEPVPNVNRYYTFMAPPPPPPVTESVQVPKDPMMMYAPGPSSYQVPTQTSKQNSYQGMKPPITHQMQAMQSSNLPPVQTMETSVPSSPQHVMQSSMASASGPSGYQGSMQISKQNPYHGMQTTITHQMQAMQASNLPSVQTMETSLPSSPQHVMQSQMASAPGPSGYQGSMQTSKQNPYQGMQTTITHQMQAMQASNLPSVQTMETSLPSSPQHVMQSPMASAPGPSGYQGSMQTLKQNPYQGTQTAITHQTQAMHASNLPSMQTMESLLPSSPQHVMQSPMQASLHPMQAPPQAMPMPLQMSTQELQQMMQVPPPVDIYANPKPQTSSSSTPWPQFETCVIIPHMSIYVLK